MKRIAIPVLLATLILSACAPASTPTPAPATMSLPISTPTLTVAPTAIPTITQMPTEGVVVVSTPIAGTPTATPDLADFRVDMWSYTSPDGKWTAQVIVALPVIDDTAVSSNYYAQLKLSKTDGTTEWIIVDEWSEWGLGYTVPQPLHWSHDGRYLYFTNKPVPDGCAVFVNGSDLRRVDLSDGSVREIVPSAGLWLSLSPDETMLAYIGYGDRGLVIRDLATGTERETKLDPGKDYQAGHILWSPDGTTIMLALAIRPCSTDWAESTSIIRVDVATLGQVALIQEDKRLFVPVEWTTSNQVLLKDKGGDYWLMDVRTGQVTRK
jgi:hypothetical protein